MSARFGMRAAQGFRPPFARQNIRFGQRRCQSTAETTAGSGASESGFSKFWNSPVGPKTVHFWAPIMKWGMVLAGAADFTRHPSQLSQSQNAALVATGAIWTRWCFVIKPRNVFLASVNFLVFCVGSTQVTRILLYQQQLKQDGLGDEVKKAANEEKNTLEQIIEDPKSVKDAVMKGK